MSTRGIDISGCQPKLDYKSLKKSGVKYAFIKCSEGLKESFTWEQHVNGCLSVGMHIGAYSYIVAESVSEARVHAQVAIQSLNKFFGKIDCPVFVDMEDSKYYEPKWTVKLRTAIFKAFAEELSSAGYYVGAYINPSWLETYIDKSAILGTYDVWLAAWTENPNKNTKYHYNQTAWQWGLDKTLGVQGGVDGDLIYVDYPNKIRKSGKNFLSPASSKKVYTVFHSYGEAAMRYQPSKSAKFSQRCEKDKLYPISEVCTVDGKLWLRHATNGTWSMEREDLIYFQSGKPYTEMHATSRLNVRAGDSTSSNVVGTLEKGAPVYVTEYKKGWSKIIYQGVERYVSTDFIDFIK